MLSIIIPVYKTERYLPKCLDSLLAQSYTDWEAVLVDDGSPDDSGAVCDAYAAQDSRFKVIHQPNAGPGAARNHGLDEAQGEFVCFVDSDDWVAPDFLEQIMQPRYVATDILFWGYTAAYPDHEEQRTVPELYGEGQTEAWQVIAELKRQKMFGYMWVDRFRRSLLVEHQIRFATDIRVHEDLCFTNEYCQYITSAAALPCCGYHYRQEGASLSNRFYPSDECMRIARHLKASSEPWWDGSCLAEMEMDAYMSKLNLAVMNMFDEKEQPRKSWHEKLARISEVKREMEHYYGRYPSLKKTSYKIFHFLNPLLICCYQSLFRYIR